MPTPQGLSDAGLSVPRLADYLDLIRAEYEDDTSLEVDWDNDLVLGVLTAIMARLLDGQAEILQAIYDSFDPDAAVGVQLANLAAIAGVRRTAAVRATVTLRLTGTAGTAIPLGRVAEGGGEDGRARWQTTADATIGAGGTVDVVAEAVEPGYTTALAGEIDAIVTPVTGWTGVTNPAAASPGADAEDDQALRVRRRQSIQLSAGLGIGALRSKVLELAYVTSCSVLDNPDNEDKVIEGMAMLAHSTLVVVLPNPLTTSQQDELLRLIYDNTPVATRHSAVDVVGAIIGLDGVLKAVGFDYGEDLTVNVVVTLTMTAGYSKVDAGAALKRLIEENFEALRLGDDVRELPAMALAATVPGILGAVFTFNSSANLAVTAVQRAVMGSWSVL